MIPLRAIEKDEKGDMVTDSHKILARWRNQFSQLLKVHWTNDVRQTEIHRAEPQVQMRLSWLLKSLEVINYQILIKLQQRQEEQKFTIRSIN